MKILSAMLLAITFSQVALADVVVSCDQSALIVTNSEKANRFDITVLNKQLSRFMARSSGYALSDNGTLVITGAVLTADGKSFVTSQFGPSLTAQGEGARFIMKSYKMTSSHSYESKIVVDWTFNTCTKSL